jgi:hypothetical protein
MVSNPEFIITISHKIIRLIINHSKNQCPSSVSLVSEENSDFPSSSKRTQKGTQIIIKDNWDENSLRPMWNFCDFVIDIFPERNRLVDIKYKV